MLEEKNILKQIEISYQENGIPFYIFAEYSNKILKDGIEIASTSHRDSFPIESNEGKALIEKLKLDLA